MIQNKYQGRVFLILLAIYAFAAFLTYTFFVEELTAVVGAEVPDLGVPKYVLGLANAGIILVIYGLLGVAGYWFARRLDLPGIFSEYGDWRRWLLFPFYLGLICGFVLVAGDYLFSRVNDLGRFPHPGFPASFLASLSAGIGEEIAFRGFVFGLWGVILNWIFKRFTRPKVSFWIANVIAALAFGVSHLPSVMYLTGVNEISNLNPVLILEIILLNGIVGIVAGDRYIKDGLIAAAGVHFWTDIVFHVVWGLF
jgi:membrane protease YdiL (CAAX protease family)